LKEPTLRALTRFDRFDVFENDTGYKLRAEVAGAKKEASSHTLAIR
jgi:HSP20 family molecular chaperone IbpA